MSWEACHDTIGLYHDKRTIWAEACHDTIDCIVTGGLRGMAAGCVAIQHSQGCDKTSGKGLDCDTNVVSSPRGGLRYAQGRVTQGHDTAA